MLRTEYDQRADAVYAYLSDQPYAFGKDLDDARRVDYAADGTPIGVELLFVSKGVDLSDLPRSDELADALKQYNISQLA